MTYATYRAQAQHAYATFQLPENPDEARRRQFTHPQGSALKPLRLAYRQLAHGVYTMDLQDFIERYPAEAQTYILDPAPDFWKQRQFYAYSAAAAQRILVIFVAAGIRHAQPIFMHTLLEPQGATDTVDMCMVILAAHAQAIIVDTYHKKSGTHISCMLYHTGAHAQLTVLYDYHMAAATNTRAAHYFLCHQASTTNITALMQSAGTSTIWFDLHTQGSDAYIQLQGLYALTDTAQAHLFSEQQHHAPHSTSMLTLNGCLTDHAHAEYQGRIHIKPTAQGSTAQQRNHTVLASETARAVSTPSLEALAHQIQCVHASAVGTLDQVAIAYLMTRGLSETQARRLLLQGFIRASLQNNNTSLETSIERVCTLF